MSIYSKWLLVSTLLGHRMKFMSETNETLLELIFSTADAQAARTKIDDYLSMLSAQSYDDSSKLRERLADALLKLSGGHLDKLDKAIAIGDFRDILVAARFANSDTIHKEWEKQTIARRTKRS